MKTESRTDFELERLWLSQDYLVALELDGHDDISLQTAFLEDLLNVDDRLPCETVEIGGLMLAWARRD